MFFFFHSIFFINVKFPNLSFILSREEFRIHIFVSFIYSFLNELILKRYIVAGIDNKRRNNRNRASAFMELTVQWEILTDVIRVMSVIKHEAETTVSMTKQSNVVDEKCHHEEAAFKLRLGFKWELVQQNPGSSSIACSGTTQCLLDAFLLSCL